MNTTDEKIKVKNISVKYYALTPDKNSSMKEFLEFDKLKKKLARPVKKTGAKVIINGSDEAFAKQFLFQTNYYDFSIYRKCLPKREDTTFSFQDCVELYEFNSFLRENLMKFTGKIELLIKSSIIHTLCSNYEGNLQKGECYLDKSIYKNENDYQEFIERIGMRLFELKDKSLPISHHVSNKDCKFPFWVVVPELTFGETTKIIEQLNDKFYSLWVEELFLSNDYYKNDDNMQDHIISASKSWISATWFIRNVCAHYGRLYARNFNVGVPRFYTPVLRKMKEYGKKKTDNKDLFAYMLAIKQILICHNSSIHDEWDSFINEIERKFMTSSIIEKTKIGFPECWKDCLIIKNVNLSQIDENKIHNGVLNKLLLVLKKFYIKF